jgi:hypothetical protein
MQLSFRGHSIIESENLKANPTTKSLKGLSNSLKS